MGTHFIFFFFLLLSLFLPLRFHFHIHGRRRKIFFFVETSFAGLPFLHRTFSLTLEWPQKTEGKREKETQPAAGGGNRRTGRSFPAGPRRIKPYLHPFALVWNWRHFFLSSFPLALPPLADGGARNGKKGKVFPVYLGNSVGVGRCGVDGDGYRYPLGNKRNNSRAFAKELQV